jgi:large subunit ribosomal protein L29
MARKNKQAIAELRDLSDADLAKELDEAYRQLFTSRLQLATRQLANTSQPRKTRLRIARIRTVQRQRQLAAAQTAGAES